MVKKKARPIQKILSYEEAYENSKKYIKNKIRKLTWHTRPETPNYCTALEPDIDTCYFVESIDTEKNTIYKGGFLKILNGEPDFDNCFQTCESDSLAVCQEFLQEEFELTLKQAFFVGGLEDRRRNGDPEAVALAEMATGILGSGDYICKDCKDDKKYLN